MALAFIGSATASGVSPSVPGAARAGDLICVVAFRDGSATAPTVPAGWNQFVIRSTSPSLVVAWAIWDGGSIPNFTNATQVTTVVWEGYKVDDAYGGQAVGGGTSTTITFPAITMENTNNTSHVVRAAVDTRPDVTFPTPAGHTVIEVSGTRPGYGKWRIGPVSAAGSVSVTVSRSSAYSTATFEINAAQIAPASAPTPSFGTVLFNSAVINWSNPSGTVERVKVQRATSAGGTYTDVADLPAATLTFTDTTVVSNTTYWYRIQTVNGAGTFNGTSASVFVPLPTIGPMGGIASAQAFGTALVRDRATRLTSVGAIASLEAFGTSSVGEFWIPPPIIDDFEIADGPLAAEWTGNLWAAEPAPVIAGGDASNTGQTTVWTSAYRNDGEIFGDVEAYAFLSAFNAQVDLYVHAQNLETSTFSGYSVVAHPDGRLILVKYIDGVNVFGTNVSTTMPWSAGSGFGIRVRNGQLSAWHRPASGGAWVQVGSSIADTDLNSGAIGFEFGNTGLAEISSFGGTTPATLSDYETSVLSDNPVSFYPLNETGTTVAIDHSGNHNDGAYQGTYTQGVPGLVDTDPDTAVQFAGGGVQFSGQDVVGAPMNISIGSIEAWIDTANTDNNYHGIFVKQSAYGLFVKAAFLMAYDYGTDTDQWAAATDVANGTRHQVGMAFQSGVTNGTQLYVDGQPYGPPITITVLNQGDGNPHIGTDPSVHDFDGVIGKVSIYDYTLSPAQFAAHYDAGVGIVGAHTVTLGGIASSESFGSTTVTKRKTLAPSGIASAEAFGPTTVRRRNVLSTSGISSAESFGSATILKRKTLTLSGIASAESFGTLTRQGRLTLGAAGIASAEAFGIPVLGSFAVVSATGVPSAEAFGTAQVNRTVLLSSILSQEAFGTASVGSSVAFVGIGIPSAESFGSLHVSSEFIQEGGVGYSWFTVLLTSDHVEPFVFTVVVEGITSAEEFGSSRVGRYVLLIRRAVGRTDVAVTEPVTDVTDTPTLPTDLVVREPFENVSIQEPLHHVVELLAIAKQLVVSELKEDIAHNVDSVTLVIDLHALLSRIEEQAAVQKEVSAIEPATSVADTSAPSTELSVQEVLAAVTIQEPLQEMAELLAAPTDAVVTEPKEDVEHNADSVTAVVDLHAHSSDVKEQ